MPPDATRESSLAPGARTPERGDVVVPIRAVGERRSGFAPWVALLLVLVPLARVIAHLTADSGWSPIALAVDVALCVAVGAALVPPARLRHSEGTATFTEVGMLVRYHGLLSRDWFVPVSDIASVKIGPHVAAGSSSPVLGLSARHANVLVTFVERAPAIPVRARFLPASLLGNWGRHRGVPAPQATLQSVGWCADDIGSDPAKSICALLAGERTTTRTYAAASPRPSEHPGV